MQCFRLVVPLALLVASACSDSGQSCEILAPSLSVSDSARPDWRVEAREILATAPPDSGIYIGVVPAAASVEAWADSSPDVEISYVFITISAFSVSMPVRALSEMVNLDGIRWVEWSRGRDYQLCSY